jgi:hypothetical protein
MNHPALLGALAQDKCALLALASGDKAQVLNRIRYHYPGEPSNDEQLFRKALTWICEPQPSTPCPDNVAIAAKSWKNHQKAARISKRHFISESGLNMPPTDRNALLDSLPIIPVEALSDPYPPYKELIAETPTISEKWRAHFAFGKQPDARHPRLTIHQLRSADLAADIVPSESARFVTADGQLVGLVMRDFCPSKAAAVWADAEAVAQLPDRRNIRVRSLFYI